MCLLEAVGEAFNKPLQVFYTYKNGSPDRYLLIKCVKRQQKLFAWFMDVTDQTLKVQKFQQTTQERLLLMQFNHEMLNPLCAIQTQNSLLFESLAQLECQLAAVLRDTPTDVRFKIADDFRSLYNLVESVQSQTDLHYLLIRSVSTCYKIKFGHIYDQDQACVSSSELQNQLASFLGFFEPLLTAKNLHLETKMFTEP